MTAWPTPLTIPVINEGITPLAPIDGIEPVEQLITHIKEGSSKSEGPESEK